MLPACRNTPKHKQHCGRAHTQVQALPAAACMLCWCVAKTASAVRASTTRACHAPCCCLPDWLAGRLLLLLLAPCPETVLRLTSLALSFSASPTSALLAARSLPARSTKLTAAVVTATDERALGKPAAAACCRSCGLFESAAAQVQASQQRQVQRTVSLSYDCCCIMGDVLAAVMQAKLPPLRCTCNQHQLLAVCGVSLTLHCCVWRVSDTPHTRGTRAAAVLPVAHSTQHIPAAPLSGLLSMYKRTMAWLRLLWSFMRVARVCNSTQAGHVETQ